MSYHALDNGVESTWATNHLGGFLLTELLLPRLRSACATLHEPSRVVVVASDSHYGPLLTKEVTSDSALKKVIKPSEKEFSAVGAYGSSKLANVQFAAHLHRQESPQVVACSLHPGSAIATDIARGSTIATFAMKHVLSWFTKTMAQGTSTTVACIVDKAERLEGNYFSDCQEKIASSRARDERAQELLWAASSQLCRL